jgi:hypothetical protein
MKILDVKVSCLSFPSLSVHRKMETPRKLASRDFLFNEAIIDLGRYGRTLTVLHATQIPDGEERVEQDADEDPEAGKFDQDGKRVRY